MQKTIEKFNSDIRVSIEKSAYSRKIYSVVLLGSAARGEWIKGQSDIDIIVVVRKSKDKEEAYRFFNKLLGRLNKKYSMKLEKTTTVGEKSKNPIINMVMGIESFVFFGVPFYVVSLEDYDFFHNKIKDPRVWFLATFLGSINTFLLSVKKTAKVIYGKDILKMIDVRLSYFDKFMVNLEQFYIILASFIILPFDSKLAAKHSMKAVLYQEEIDLLFLGKDTKGYMKDVSKFNKTFIGSIFLKKHLKKTVRYRKNKNFKITKKEAINYIFDTIRFLRENNERMNEFLHI